MFLYQANLANAFSSPRIYCPHPLRCTALGFTLALAIFFSVHLSSPSTQLGQLGVLMDQTEEDIRRAMVHAYRSYSDLGAFKAPASFPAILNRGLLINATESPKRPRW
jgi:hypothetical protein